jgi:hypothetical protein
MTNWQIDADVASRGRDVLVEIHTLETLAAADHANILARVRPDRVLVASCTTHLQAQFVIELAARAIPVTVATTRRTLLTLVDDIETAQRWIDG